MFFRAINTATVPNVTGHHFFDIFSPSYFLIKTSFFCDAFLLLLNWSWSYSFGLGLGRGLHLLVLFPSLIIGLISDEQTIAKCARFTYKIWPISTALDERNASRPTHKDFGNTAPVQCLKEAVYLLLRNVFS